MKKKLIAVILSVVTAATVLTGCGQPKQENSDSKAQTKVEQEEKKEEKQEEKKSDEKITFTDSVGRTVEIPKNIERIAPCGNPAQVVLLTFAPEKMVGLAGKIGNNLEKYVDPKVKDLPVFGAFYGKGATMNVEAVVKEKPDLLIDIGEVKKTIKEDMDSIQEKSNIPTIFIECTLDKMDQTYKTLGEILGNQEKGDQMAKYIKDSLNQLKTFTMGLPEDKVKSIYYGEDKDGLSTVSKDSFHSEIYNYINIRNVADIPKVSSGKGGNIVSMEQVIKWNPDIIIFAPKSVYSEVKDSPLWNKLKAVQESNYYEIPDKPYNFVGRPPSINRLIGMKWLANLAYPGLFNYDMNKEVKDFYKMFYNYEMTDDEVTELLKNATPIKK